MTTPESVERFGETKMPKLHVSYVKDTCTMISEILYTDANVNHRAFTYGKVTATRDLRGTIAKEKTQVAVP